MPYSIRNSGRQWTKDDLNALKKMAHENTPTRIMGFKLGRTLKAIQKKAEEKRISLKSKEQLLEE